MFSPGVEMAVPLRVLVVDDEECMRASITMILDFHGFSAESAGDTHEAIEKMKAERFDVVLTDLRMAGPDDGLVVFQEAREKHPEALALLMSAHPDLSGAASSVTLRSE